MDYILAFLFVFVPPFLIPSIFSYMVGSIPFGLILTKRVKGIDLREIGSKNIGTTNVLRTGSKTLALVTLLLDTGKGSIFPLIFWFAYNLPNFSTFNFNFYFAFDPFPAFIFFPFSSALVLGFGAILGHCFPVWLRFKGGKGVATGFGVLLAAVPYSGLAALATWLLVAFAFRYSSLSALCAYLIAPIVTLIMYGTAPGLICALISAFIWWRHKDNIKRLLAGEESKIGGTSSRHCEE